MLISSLTIVYSGAFANRVQLTDQLAESFLNLSIYAKSDTLTHSFIFKITAIRTNDSKRIEIFNCANRTRSLLRCVTECESHYDTHQRINNMIAWLWFLPFHAISLSLSRCKCVCVYFITWSCIFLFARYYFYTGIRCKRELNKPLNLV